MTYVRERTCLQFPNKAVVKKVLAPAHARTKHRASRDVRLRVTIACISVISIITRVPGDSAALRSGVSDDFFFELVLLSCLFKNN